MTMVYCGINFNRKNWYNDNIEGHLRQFLILNYRLKIFN